MVPSACRLSLRPPRRAQTEVEFLGASGVIVMRIYGLVITIGVTWAIFHALGIPLSSLLALVK